MNRKKEKGFALVLSLVLLLVMSLMGGSLIVITSSDHQSNNNSDQYQQAFYVAETGLMQGEKWVVDQYLGPWTKHGDLPSAEDILGEYSGSTDAAEAIYNAQKTSYEDTVGNYHKHSNDMTRFEYDRGPPSNDFEIKKKTDCMNSFKNIEVAETLNIVMEQEQRINFINIIGPILLNDTCADYETCGDVEGSADFNTDFLVEKTDGSLELGSNIDKIVKKEVEYLRRFEYEFFITNVGPAAYKGSGSSVAKATSSSSSQGTAYKIYACGIFYGKSADSLHNGEIEILIPLETVIVMPS